MATPAPPAPTRSQNALRIWLPLAGSVAAIAYYYLLEDQRLMGFPEQWHRFSIYTLIGLFPGFAYLSGAMTPLWAFCRAALVSASGAMLVLLVGTRFPPTAKFDEVIAPGGQWFYVVPFFVFMILAIPFVITFAQKRPRPLAYEGLFDIAWTRTVTTIVAFLFLGLFWAVYLTSDGVLSLVGITVLGDIADEQLYAMILSGLALGLGYAVTSEMERVVLTLRDLILGLLRLMLPLVALVGLVFVLAALIGGIEQVFDDTSAAGLMIGISIGAITLISAAIGRDDADATQSRVFIWSVRALVALIPVFVAVALYAIWLRVGEYGWTPARLFVLLLILHLAGYAVLYLRYGGLMRAGWQGGIRRANVWMALAGIGIIMLWHSPILNAERIATASQVARIADGRLTVDDLDLWPMKQEWGYAGARGIATLAAMKDHPDAADLATMIAALDQFDSHYLWQTESMGTAIRADFDRLLSRIPTKPAARELPEAAEIEFERWNVQWVKQMQTSCFAQTMTGDPQCIAIFDDFLTDVPGEEILLIGWVKEAGVTSVLLTKTRDGRWKALSTIQRVQAAEVGALMTRLHAGEYQVTAPDIRRLSVGEMIIEPYYDQYGGSHE